MPDLRRRTTTLLIAFLGLGYAPGRGDAQPLTLADALTRAERDAFSLRASRGQLQSQQALASQALRGVLPSIRLEAGAIRTSDPIGVFGTKLRQQDITPADFAPSQLNFPVPKTNFTGAVVIEQPLINLDAWKGRSAALQQTVAAQAQLEDRRSSARLSVVQAFYQALLARERIDVLALALSATEAHARAAASMAKNGLATPADELQARVYAANTSRELFAAQHDAAAALGALCLAIGCVDDSVTVLSGSLPSTQELAGFGKQLLASPEVYAHPEVVAADASERSAELNLSRSKRLLAPRINAVARLDWNDPSLPFASSHNWTVGVMASWSLFTGGSELAEMAHAAGTLASARAMADAARATTSVQLNQGRGALAVSIRGLALADSSLSLAETAHRLVTRRYEGGLATIAELLSALAAESASRLSVLSSRFEAVSAAATYLHALGSDPGRIASLANESR